MLNLEALSFYDNFMMIKMAGMTRDTKKLKFSGIFITQANTNSSLSVHSYLLNVKLGTGFSAMFSTSVDFS